MEPQLFRARSIIFARLSSALLLAALLLALWAAPVAAAPPERFNVTVTIGWEGKYRPMEWTPINIDLVDNKNEFFEGRLALTVEQNNLTPVTIYHDFAMTPGQVLHLPLMAKIAFSASSCHMTITNRRTGRRLWEDEPNFYDFSGRNTKAVVEPIQVADVVVATVGRSEPSLRRAVAETRSWRMNPQGQGYVSNRGYFTPGPVITDDGEEQPQGSQKPQVWVGKKGRPSGVNCLEGKLVVAEELQRNLPWDWTAYSSIDLLVLYDPNWLAMTPEQSRAIVQWVGGGGRLLIVLGTHVLPADHPIAKLMPLKISTPREVRAGRTHLVRWFDGLTGTEGVDPGPELKLAVWPLELAAGSGWQAERGGWLKEPAAAPIYASGYVGFGQVGVLAFDPARIEGIATVDLGDFWPARFNGLLDACGLVPGKEDDKSNNYNYSYQLDASAAATNNVLNFIYDIPAMRPFSMFWIIGLLAALALVLGPIDYTILKRLDRQPWTWITLSLYILIFTATAYYGVRLIRRGDEQIVAVSVVDAVEGRPGAWSCLYAGIFAPETDDYRLAGPKGEALKGDQWWSSIVAVSGDYLNRYDNSAVLGSPMECRLGDGGCLPAYLPINIWAMKSLLVEAPRERSPLKAELRRLSNGELRGRITNQGDSPISGGAIRRLATTEDQVSAPQTPVMTLRFGALEPGQSIEIENQKWAMDGTEAAPSPKMRYRAFRLSPEDEEIVSGEDFNIETAGFAAGSLKRARTMQAQMAAGAVVVSAEFQQAPLPFRLQDRPSQVRHRQLARLVTWPTAAGADAAGPDKSGS